MSIQDHCIYKIDDIIPYGELPLNKPADIKRMVQWLWESFFSDELSQHFSINDYEIKNDFNAPNSVYIK